VKEDDDDDDDDDEDVDYECQFGAADDAHEVGPFFRGIDYVLETSINR
jgi:hypothetical protein